MKKSIFLSLAVWTLGGIFVGQKTVKAEFEREDDDRIRIVIPKQIITPGPTSANLETLNPAIETDKNIADPEMEKIINSQNQAQIEIRKRLQTLDNQNKWHKLIFGPNWQVLAQLKAFVAENASRSEQLQKLGGQEGVEAIIEKENEQLQARIQAEEKTRSLLGWLFKWIRN